VTVLGGLDRLGYVAEHHGVRRILIATKKLPLDVLRALHAFGAAHDLELLELEIRVRVVQGNGNGSGNGNGNGDEKLAGDGVSPRSQETAKATSLRVVAQ